MFRWMAEHGIATERMRLTYTDWFFRKTRVFLSEIWHNRKVGLKQQTRYQEIGMAKVCPITGKRPMAGNKVSHANNKTRRRWEPNLQWKRIWVPSEKKFVRMRVSARGLRTINKLGVEAALLSAKG